MNIESVTTNILFGIKDFVPKSFKNFMRKNFKSRFKTLDWSEIEYDMLPVLVNEKRGAFDIGANAGDYTKKLSGLCASVTAFEPDVALAAQLAARYPGVSVVNCALSASKGSMTYRIPVVDGKIDIATATLRTENLSDQFIERVVETRTLDEFADTDVGFVKMDVEGHELAVLEGGKAFLAKQRPVVLIETQDSHKPGAPDAVRSFFEGLGYCGVFIFRKKTYPISELTAAMTDERHLSRPIPRKDMPYVNNFIYFPTQALAEQGRADMERLLSGAA